MTLAFPKPPRRRKRKRTWRDEITPTELQFVEFVESQRCSVPNCDTHSEFDHVPTVGSQGKAHAKGWPLCRQHHTERHAIGLGTFQSRYRIKFNATYKRLMRDFIAGGF